MNNVLAVPLQFPILTILKSPVTTVETTNMQLLDNAGLVLTAVLLNARLKKNVSLVPQDNLII